MWKRKENQSPKHRLASRWREKPSPKRIFTWRRGRFSLQEIYLPEDGNTMSSKHLSTWRRKQKQSSKYLSEEGNRTSLRNMYLPEDGDRTNIIETSIGLCLNMAIKAVSETSVYMRTEVEPMFQTCICPTHRVSISELYVYFILPEQIHTPWTPLNHKAPHSQNPTSRGANVGSGLAQSSQASWRGHSSLPPIWTSKRNSELYCVFQYFRKPEMWMCGWGFSTALLKWHAGIAQSV
jgi:hypothetical protein